MQAKFNWYNIIQSFFVNFEIFVSFEAIMEFKNFWSTWEKFREECVICRIKPLTEIGCSQDETRNNCAKKYK